jgi:hypothetical protein
MMSNPISVRNVENFALKFCFSGENLYFIIPQFCKIHLHSHPQMYLCDVMLLFMNAMGLLSSVIPYHLETAKYAADT